LNPILSPMVQRVVPPLPRLIGRVIPSYRQRLQSAVGNSHEQWRIEREVLHADDHRDDVSAVDAERLCCRFSRYFCDKLKQIADDIDDRLLSTVSIPCRQTPRSCNVIMDDFTPVTVDEMTRLIKLLPPKSCPLDCMPTLLLKAFVDALAPLLTLLANMSLTSGQFPAKYKVGRVTPLLRKRDSTRTTRSTTDQSQT
jgi:hypothetical protein